MAKAAPPTEPSTHHNGIPKPQSTSSGSSSFRSDFTSEKHFTALEERVAAEESLLSGASSALVVDPVTLVQTLLTHVTPERRIKAAQTLSSQHPSPEIVAALACAAKNDSSEVVRVAVGAVVKDLCRDAAGVTAMVQGLLLAVGAETKDIGRFCLNDVLINVSVNRMTDQISDREQRIDATVNQIREVVAGLSDPEEQREAEVKSLVSSVPPTAPYPKQLEAFTGITHVMRTLMARQLEPKFREHLRDDSPRIERKLDGKPTQQNRDLAQRKEQFAESVTDGLFRLGLGVRLDGGEQSCYIGSGCSHPNVRGRYRIFACGNGEQLDAITDWFTTKAKDAPLPFTRVGLQDAAPPGGGNSLNRSRNR